MTLRKFTNLTHLLPPPSKSKKSVTRKPSCPDTQSRNTNQDCVQVNVRHSSPTLLIFLPWRWNQLIPLKHWFIFTQLNCVTSYETIFFKITAVKNSCLARKHTSSTYFSSFSPLSFNKFVSTRFWNRTWNSILVHWIKSTQWARPFCATFYWLLSAI